MRRLSEVCAYYNQRAMTDICISSVTFILVCVMCSTHSSMSSGSGITNSTGWHHQSLWLGLSWDHSIWIYGDKIPVTLFFRHFSMRFIKDMAVLYRGPYCTSYWVKKNNFYSISNKLKNNSEFPNCGNLLHGFQKRVAIVY